MGKYSVKKKLKNGLAKVAAVRLPVSFVWQTVKYVERIKE